MESHFIAKELLSILIEQTVFEKVSVFAALLLKHMEHFFISKGSELYVIFKNNVIHSLHFNIFVQFRHNQYILRY